MTMREKLYRWHEELDEITDDLLTLGAVISEDGAALREARLKVERVTAEIFEAYLSAQREDLRRAEMTPSGLGFVKCGGADGTHA